MVDQCTSETSERGGVGEEVVLARGRAIEVRHQCTSETHQYECVWGTLSE